MNAPTPDPSAEAIDKDFAEVQAYLMTSASPAAPFRALSRLVKLARRAPTVQGADPGQPATGLVEAAKEAIRILNMVGEAPVGRVKAGQAATALETALSAREGQ